MTLCMGTDLDSRVDRICEETRLSEREATAVALAVDGMDYRQIAEEMDITRQAAHQFLQRAEQKAEEAQRTVALLKEIGFIGGQ